ncbi:MAG: S-layer homology domain-containing protein [Oscillospiraceae bacterium]|nr:S-layer homology domain-containing protein [Oscillospiraceae bacterium]
MRNMKRVLSLVLAMVMLLGMLTIPTGAANNFADADQIVNTEAVDITAGMGLFAGSDGKFNPQGTVTRAQMATIIVKMMYGSDFNADSFKGAGNPFPDTAAFEGGWAEGYINACFQMGVVKGYGDGTFKPGNQVTTAEAVTMIINALKVDAGEGEWPNTVMAKATEMKLFGDLKPAPATNTALIRDQLAVIVLEGLQYSPSGSNTYTYTTPGGKTLEFPSLEDAMTTVGVENAESLTVTPAEDTLAKKVYNLKIETGFVTDNQATGADYTVVGDVDFDVETGLDMIGHYVSVYYQVPKSNQSVDAYKVYTVVDESEVVTVSEDIEAAKEFKAAFGKNYVPAESVLVFENDYNLSEATTITGSYTAGSVADAGTYVINDNKIVAYLKPATRYASYIASISEFDGEKTYMLGGMYETIAEEDITLYLGAKKDDFVTFVKAKDQYVLSPVDPMKGTISKTGKNSDGEDVLTLNGQEYVAFGAANNYTAGAELTIAVDSSTFEYGEQYVMYVTQDNLVVGWKLSEGGSSDIDVNKIVYAKGAFQKTIKDSYGAKTVQYVLQAVNVQGKEEHYLLAEERPATGVTLDGNFDWNNGISAYTEGFYVLEDYNDPTDPNNSEAKKAGIKTVSPVGLRSNMGTEMDNGWTYAENLFYGANRWGGSSIKVPASTSNNHVCTTSCKGFAGGSAYHSYNDDNSKDKNTFRTYYTDATQFLMVHGEKGEELKCAAGGQDFSVSLAGNSTFTLPMLFTVESDGFIQVVMTVFLKDPEDLSADNPTIYVADSKPMGTAPGGDVYQAYVAKTAEPIEIVVIAGTAVTAGFKEYTVDEDGRYKLSDSPNDSTYMSMVLTGVTSAGRLNAYDPNYNTSSTSKMETPTNTTAKSAKIVDLRSEDNIKESGVGTITTLEQLRTLVGNKYVVNFDSYTGDSTTYAIYITSAYKTPMEDVEVYVTAPAGKAGSSTVAYSTVDGNKTAIALTQNSTVEGFATMVFNNQEKYLVASEGDQYLVNETVNGMTPSGSNVTVTTAEGSSFTVNAATVIAKTEAGITSPATLAADYAQEQAKGGTYSVSAIVVDGKATFFIITTRGNANVREGDIIKLTEKANPAGGTTTGTKDGADGSFEFKYVQAVYEAQAYADVVETGEYYYTATKDAQGNITLTFVYNFVPTRDTATSRYDVIFVPGTVKAGDVVEGYVMNVEGVPANEIVLIKTSSDSTWYSSTSVAAGSTGNTFGRFWKMLTGSDGMRAVQGAIGSNSGVFTYHDQIVNWNSATRALETGAGVGHTGSGAKCGYANEYKCEDTTDTNQEAAKNLTVAADATILDLTGRGYDSIEDLDEIGVQTRAGNAVVNIYVPGSSTAEVIIVLPPKSDFTTTNGIITVPANEHGTVEVNKEAAPVGDSVKVTATPIHGYKLVKIMVDGKDVAGSFFTVRGDHTVTAEFKQLPYYNVTANWDESRGSVTMDSLMDGETEDKDYAGDLVTVTCEPVLGYQVTGVTVDGEPATKVDDNVYTFTVKGDHAVVVTYGEDTTLYNIDEVQPEDGSGTVSVDKNESQVGKTVTVTATPAAGYTFVSVVVDGEPIDGNTFVVTGNHTVTAIFGQNYSLTDVSTGGELTFLIDGNPVTGGLNGKEVTVTGTATGDDAYSLAAIKVDGVLQDGLSFTIGKQDSEVEGIFAYVPQAGDVFFIPGTVTEAASVVEGYVIDTQNAKLKAGDPVDIFVPADASCPDDFAANYATGRFWEVDASGILTCIYNVTASGSNGADRYGYHDFIYKTTTNDNAKAIIINDHSNHTSSCALDFAEDCGVNVNSKYRAGHEVGPYLILDDANSLILDLRAEAQNDPSKAIATRADLERLTANNNTVGLVNTYSADAVYTSQSGYKNIAGTVTALVIVDMP